jgi:hypothetical protein
VELIETFSPQVNAFKTNGGLILFTLEVWEEWQLQSRRAGLNPAAWRVIYRTDIRDPQEGGEVVKRRLCGGLDGGYPAYDF